MYNNTYNWLSNRVDRTYAALGLSYMVHNGCLSVVENMNILNFMWQKLQQNNSMRNVRFCSQKALTIVFIYWEIKDWPQLQQITLVFLHEFTKK